jgi:hypothetical protein
MRMSGSGTTWTLDPRMAKTGVIPYKIIAYNEEGEPGSRSASGTVQVEAGRK